MATQREVAVHLDLTQPAVSQLVAAGVLAPAGGRGAYSIDDCRVAYMRHLRGIAAGRSAGDAQTPNLVGERARLAAAQAEAQERRNARDRGELVPIADVTHTMTGAFAIVRSQLLAFPDRAAPQLHAERTVKGVRQRLADLVHEVLTDLSRTNVEAVGDTIGAAAMTDANGEG